jgi:predicted nuclease of predicted toxin-antitoxin system
VKLLLDQNLSHRLVKHLFETFPGSNQVSLLGMAEALDHEIWAYAKENGFAIVTLDADFHERSMLFGGPPLVVWLKCGNQPRSVILDKILANSDAIMKAAENPDTWCVEVY